MRSLNIYIHAPVGKSLDRVTASTPIEGLSIYLCTIGKEHLIALISKLQYHYAVRDPLDGVVYSVDL